MTSTFGPVLAAELLILCFLGAQASFDCDRRKPCLTPCAVKEYCEECLGHCTPCEFLCDLNINDIACKKQCPEYVKLMTQRSVDAPEYPARIQGQGRGVTKSSTAAATQNMKTVTTLKASSTNEKPGCAVHDIAIWTGVALLGFNAVAVCVLLAVFIGRKSRKQATPVKTACSRCYHSNGYAQPLKRTEYKLVPDSHVDDEVQVPGSTKSSPCKGNPRYGTDPFSNV